MKGLGALNGKMLFIRIIENNKFHAYFRSGEKSPPKLIFTNPRSNFLLGSTPDPN